MAELTAVGIGAQVREAREEKGLSRDELAYAASVSTSMIARLELQDRPPRFEAMTRIARQLDLSLDRLSETRPAP